MLEIIINKSFSLELPEGFQMQVIDENPLFINERIPVPHTINLEVNKTPANMTFFGHPDRVSSSKLFNKYKADVFHFGSLVMEGEIFILDTKQSINLQLVNAYMPENAKKPLNKLDLGGEDFGTAHASMENLDYSNPMYNQYKAAIANSVFSPDEYVTSPVRLQDVPWDGHNGAWGLKNAISMYINYFNPINPPHTNFPPTSVTIPPDYFAAYSAECIFPIVPFPYVHVIIEKVLGEYLDDNIFFTNQSLRKLVHINFNHKFFSPDNFYDIKYSGTDSTFCVFPLVDDYTETNNLIQNKWEHKSFMQEYPFNDYFRSLLKLFGISCFISKKIELVLNSDLLDTEEIFDLSQFIAKDPQISTEKGKMYVLSYGEEKTDESKTTAIVGNGSIAANFLHLLFYTTKLTRQYKVAGNPNVLYEFTKKAVGIPLNGQNQKFIVESKVISSALSVQQNKQDDDEDEKEKDVFNLTIDVKPLEMNLEQYWNELFNYSEEYINREHWFVPVVTKKDLKSAPHIMLDTGIRSTVGYPQQTHTYRALNNHHTDAYGNKVHDLSLLINSTDPDGVFLKFHKKMADWYAKDKVKITVEAVLTPMQNRDISNKSKIHVFGKNFHILKRQYSISNDRYILVTFELIEAFSVLSDDNTPS